jgi:hypothetical protein
MTPPACTVVLTFLWHLWILAAVVQLNGTDFPAGRKCCFSEASSRFHWGPLSPQGAAFLFDETV